MVEIQPNRDWEAAEVAYIFVEDCEIATISPSLLVLPRLTWLDLKLNENEDSTVAVDVDNKNADLRCCRFCELLVHCATDECSDGYLRLLNKCIRFSGFMADLKPSQTQCSPHCGRPRQSNRTDAALLLGLALTCQDHNHITIHKAQILFKEDTNAIRNENSEENSMLERRRAALYLTISVPQMDLFGSSERSMVPRGKRGALSKKSMPASTELILMLIRSDWRRFDKLVEAATKSAGSTQPSTKESPSLFPTRLTLDELYIRIHGLSSSGEEGAFNSDADAQSNPSLLAILPDEILVSNIAPYLRARSLDSLRNTCWQLHKALRYVVPGLKLKLYNHQINSLNWMRMRECRHVSEKEILSNSRLLHLQRTGGDLHRAVTGGATVALKPRTACDASVVRISQLTGHEIFTGDRLSFARNVARGGLLCDDPGLGKTITVVSLILQTIGLTTIPLQDFVVEAVQSEDNPDEIFDAYWSESMTAEYRRPTLFKLYRRLQRTDDGVKLFRAGVIPSSSRPPSVTCDGSMSLHLICKNIERDEYKDSFFLFQSDVNLFLQNAWDYFAPDNELHSATTRLSLVFDEMMKKFKADQLSSARKAYSNVNAKPNSVVAALLHKKNRFEYLKALEPSKSTLLVVPSTLLDHWELQVKLYVDLGYLTEKEAVVFSFGEESDEDLQLERIHQVVTDCAVKKTKAAFLFLDKSTVKPLPSADFLALFDIVITTTQRFTNEWKNGSFQEELKRREIHSDLSDFEFEFRDSFTASKVCPLLKVRWLRMIVDEGHSMGRGKKSSAIQFASWIYAERRWAMTGTPTRQTVGDCGISGVAFLMRYLQHEFFGSRLEGEYIWKNLVSKRWKEGGVASFFRLHALIGFLMIRHTKLDIVELPQPLFRETVVPLSNKEVKAYNSLVWAVQSNILLTSMEAETSGLQDSILDNKNFKHAFEVMRNIRLACGCGGTRVIAKLPEKFYRETIEMLEGCNIPNYKLKVADNHIIRATHEEFSSCMSCGLQLLTLLILPCGDLLCSECVKSETRACPICEKPFNVDFFQRLQPGFTVEWGDHNTPHDSMDHLHLEEESNSSGDTSIAEAGLVALQPGGPRKRTRRPKDGHICQYRPNYRDGKCVLCLEEHGACILVNRSRCRVCYRITEACPSVHSKSTFIINRLLDLHKSQQCFATSVPKTDSLDPFLDSSPRPLKAIVFSQFRVVLNYVGDRLIRSLGRGCVAEYWGRIRHDELRKFTKDPDCFCMLLGKDGSEGLDLSFVTHIFFIEQVWDKSLQNQAVARAWRMGAKGRVDVETLISEKSVEELMRMLEQETETRHGGIESLGIDDTAMVVNASESGSSDKYRRAKLHFLLKNVRFIREDAQREAPVEATKKRKRCVVWKELDEPAVRLRLGELDAIE